MVMAVVEESYYSPQKVDAWLRRWGELEALASTPRSARHLQSPECSSGHSCSYGSPVGIRSIRGHHHDLTYYSDVVADIERAWASLRYNSLPWRIVDLRMRRAGINRWRNPTTGASEQENTAQIDHIARALGIRAETAREAYRQALDSMARFLGWTPS